MPGNRSSPLPQSLVAHRLGAGLAAENSLAACEAALAAGFGALECDVKLSADGQAFLLHDDTLLRSHRNAARASALPWSRLSRPGAGPPLLSLAGLRRALAAHGDAAWVNLEIKPDADAGAALQAAWGGRVATLAAALWRDSAQPPLLSSFSIPALQAAAAAAPALPRAWLVDRLPRDWRGVAQALGARALHLAAETCSAEALAQLKAAGLQSRLYTVNDPLLQQHWLEQGADGVFTDIVPPPAVVRCAQQAAARHG